MGWIPVICTTAGKAYAFELSDDEYVLDGDQFIAFAIRRKDRSISHYVWNPTPQRPSGFRKFFSGIVDNIPRPVRGLIESSALSYVGGVLAGPGGRVVGLVASRIHSFDSLWSALADEHHNSGYFEVESGEKSSLFPSSLFVSSFKKDARPPEAR